MSDFVKVEDDYSKIFYLRKSEIKNIEIYERTPRSFMILFNRVINNKTITRFSLLREFSSEQEAEEFLRDEEIL